MSSVLFVVCVSLFFFFSSRRRHTRCYRDWSSDVCSSDLVVAVAPGVRVRVNGFVVTDNPGVTGSTEAVTFTTPARPVLVTETIVEDGGEPEIGRASCRERG